MSNPGSNQLKDFQVLIPASSSMDGGNEDTMPVSGVLVDSSVQETRKPRGGASHKSSGPKDHGPRMQLSLRQKAEICRHKGNNPKMTLVELAAWCKVQFKLDKTPSDACLSKVLKLSETWLRKAEDEISAYNLDKKKQRDGLFEALEKEVGEWVRERQAQDITLTDGVILEEARRIGNRLGVHEGPKFNYSREWLSRMKKKQCVQCFNQSPVRAIEQLNENSPMMKMGGSNVEKEFRRISQDLTTIKNEMQMMKKDLQVLMSFRKEVQRSFEMRMPGHMPLLGSMPPN